MTNQRVIVLSFMVLALVIGGGIRGGEGTITATGVADQAGRVDPSAPGRAPTKKTALLKGMYSGELHGESETGPFSMVLVIGFDGNGNVTALRATEVFGTSGLAEFDVELCCGSTYSVDADGLGTMSLTTNFYHAAYTIAVADGGNVVKIVVRSKTGDQYDASGELVRQ